MGIIKNAFRTVFAVAEAVVSTVISIGRYLFNDLIFQKPEQTIECQHSETYTLHEVDKEYIRVSREVLHEALGENPTEYLLSLDAEERLAAIQDLTNRLSELYGVEDITIDLAYSEEHDNICGYYSRQDHKIVLNCVHLLTTNPILVKDFLDTIFHEFRHVVQYQMVKSDDYKWYNNDKDVVAEFAYGLDPKNYISFSSNPRAYYEQFVEVDAREIAMCILEDSSV